jgi:uncharacterized membrane protein YraQ (UPF0718 family)
MNPITKRDGKSTGWRLAKIFLILAFLMIIASDINFTAAFQSKSVANLKTMFLSLVLESFPFLLLGAVVSAFLEVVVSEDTMARWIPHATLPGLLVAACMGMIFPLCECGIVVVAARLARKKVPMHLVTTFMLAVPVVNLIVILSTRMAFPTGPMLAYRLVGAFGIAVLSGYLIKLLLEEKNIVKAQPEPICCCSGEAHHSKGIKAKVTAILENSIEEFFNMGSYFVMGAFLSSLLQVAIPRHLITGLGNGNVSSVAAMMGLAFVLSLCSNADAFVANALSSTFSTGSIAAFLVFGAMIDLKNLFMLLGQFKKRYVFSLILIVTVLVFIYGLSINLMGGIR